ncbi:hypothetical protein BC826DRAFT_1004859 [Russula brevipes]|nr:hypothetical protein BC826DRAFT_1004859 [Russula brevipes]
MARHRTLLLFRTLTSPQCVASGDGLCQLDLCGSARSAIDYKYDRQTEISPQTNPHKLTPNLAKVALQTNVPVNCLLERNLTRLDIHGSVCYSQISLDTLPQSPICLRWPVRVYSCRS